MHPIARLLEVMGCAAIAGLVLALVAASLRQWRLALNVSRIVTCFGLGAPLLVVLIGANPQNPYFWPSSAEVDPSQKARILAEILSEVLNCGAFALLAALPSLPLWLVARWRLRSVAGTAAASQVRALRLAEKVVLLLTASVALLATLLTYFFGGGIAQVFMLGFPAVMLSYGVLRAQAGLRLVAQLVLVIALLLVAGMWGPIGTIAILLVSPAVPVGLWNARRGRASGPSAWYVHLAALVCAVFLLLQASLRAWLVH